MKKMTSIGRGNCKVISAEALGALQKVADKYGLAVKQGRGTFDETMCKLTFEFATVGEGGQVNDCTAMDFQRFATLYDLQASDLGRTFIHKGDNFTIVGLRTGASKFPIIGQHHSGKRLAFTADGVKRGMALADAKAVLQ